MQTTWEYKLEETRTRSEILGGEIYLERIAIALERCATALERQFKVKEPTAVKHAPVKANLPIATYCESFKARYGTNPVITKKDAGIMTSLAKSIPQDKLSDLIQAYVQMDDRWFLTRLHDIPTLCANLSKVAVALVNGTNDPGEKLFWGKVFNEPDQICGTNETNGSNVGRKELSSRTP